MSHRFRNAVLDRLLAMLNALTDRGDSFGGGGGRFGSIVDADTENWNGVTTNDNNKLFVFSTGDCLGLYFPDATEFPAGFRVAALILDDQAGLGLVAGPGSPDYDTRETAAFFPASLTAFNSLQPSPVEKGTLIEVTTRAAGPTNEWFVTTNVGLGLPNT